VSVKLYGMSVSHPAQAARAMLDHKGIEYELVSVMPGSQPIVLRLAGFRGRTVPALKLDGRRIQGSLSISRALEELQPDPPLFPAGRRDAVEEAEAWGECELQPLPRRFFRYGMAHVPELRRWFSADVAKLPAPAVASALSVPTARYFAHLSRADHENTRAAVERLPEVLDHVDGLIAEGIIGQVGEPTAADFQIASSISVLSGFADLDDELEGRPGTELAARLFPRRTTRVPPFLPADWLTALAPG
jgi:glutathione S-transferase